METHTYSSIRNEYVQNQQNQKKLCGWYQHQISDFDIVLEYCNEYYPQGEGNWLKSEYMGRFLYHLQLPVTTQSFQYKKLCRY